MQWCISNKLRAEEDLAQGANTIKPEVTYDMTQNPPAPIMSATEPWRASRGWSPRGTRRPDAIIPVDNSQPWSGNNVKAVVEVKLGDDSWGKGQQADYIRIAGGDPDKVVEINDENCTCPEDEEPDPLPGPCHSAGSRKREIV